MSRARLVLAGASLLVIGTGSHLLAQEIKCYVRTCAEYPDGSKICVERPIVCPTPDLTPAGT